MSGYCRGCLTKCDEFTELLQYTEKNSRLFLYSTALQVKENDSVKFQLCKDCYLSMKLACKFKKQCRNSDKLIKNYLALKETADLDFSTYLKHNDDSTTFRLPLIGNSTPAHQKVREDDNESTCTSIRNFMTDIMHDEEILDAEERIIQEVMREEPDVLDDSLDSHWLKDDASIDSDFRLDFGISPFSTPRSLNYDQYNSEKKPKQYCIPNDPAKSIEIDQSRRNMCKIDLTDALVTGSENILCTIPEETQNDSKFPDSPIQTSLEKLLDCSKIESKLDEKHVSGMTSEMFELNMKKNNKSQCPIDRNLAIALKNEANNEFALSDVLALSSSPGNHPALTPKIRSIIYGDNCNVNENYICDRNDNQALGNQGIAKDEGDILHDFFKKEDVLKSQKLNCDLRENNQNLENNKIANNQVDLLEEFFKKDDDPKMLEDGDNTDLRKNNHALGYYKEIVNEEVDILEDFFKKDDNPETLEENGIVEAYSKEYGTQRVGKEQICIQKSYCKMCKKTFRNLRGLKAHFANYHKLKLYDRNMVESRKTRFKQLRICDFCAKEYNDVRSFINHIRSHMKLKNPILNCNYCSLTFTTRAKLKMHLATHGHIENTMAQNENKKLDKKFVCVYCAAQFKYLGNYNVHVKRHTQEYTVRCSICDKGFYRKYDLDTHMRKHTGERPFKCTECPAAYKRHDALAFHVKSHYEKKFICSDCGVRFAVKYRLNAHLKSKRCIRKRSGLDIKKPTDLCQEKETDIMDLLKDDSLVPQIGDKKFNCSACGVRFAVKYRLSAHLKSKRCIRKRLGISKNKPTDLCQEKETDIMNILEDDRLESKIGKESELGEESQQLFIPKEPDTAKHINQIRIDISKEPETTKDINQKIIGILKEPERKINISREKIYILKEPVISKNITQERIDPEWVMLIEKCQQKVDAITEESRSRLRTRKVNLKPKYSSISKDVKAVNPKRNYESIICKD